ncbi:Ribonucleoprotein p18 mitochondrial precursor [Lotmaria passim]
MRRISSQLVCTAVAARFASAGAKKYDLFGYEVDTNTAPWIEKVKKCKYYDDAGEVLVTMNVKNCPPDLETYNATLQKIFEAPSKSDKPVENESKFCAMMDLMEEMQHRTAGHRRAALSDDTLCMRMTLVSCIAHARGDIAVLFFLFLFLF